MSTHKDVLKMLSKSVALVDSIDKPVTGSSLIVEANDSYTCPACETTFRNTTGGDLSAKTKYGSGPCPVCRYNPNDAKRKTAQPKANMAEAVSIIKRMIMWLGKMIADNAHMNSTLPRDAEITLSRAEEFIKRIGDAKRPVSESIEEQTLEHDEDGVACLQGSKVYDKGSFIGITVPANSVREWKSNWPVSGIPSRAIYFEFHKNGDIVDMQPKVEGEAIVALSKDAFVYAARKLNKKSKRPVSESVQQNTTEFNNDTIVDYMLDDEAVGWEGFKSFFESSFGGVLVWNQDGTFTHFQTEEDYQEFLENQKLARSTARRSSLKPKQ